jgi:hypothetical protein
MLFIQGIKFFFFFKLKFEEHFTRITTVQELLWNLVRPKFVKASIFYRTNEAQYEAQANSNLLRIIYRLSWLFGDLQFQTLYPFPKDREYVQFKHF